MNDLVCLDVQENGYYVYDKVNDKFFIMSKLEYLKYKLTGYFSTFSNNGNLVLIIRRDKSFGCVSKILLIDNDFNVVHISFINKSLSIDTFNCFDKVNFIAFNNSRVSSVRSNCNLVHFITRDILISNMSASSHYNKIENEGSIYYIRDLELFYSVKEFPFHWSTDDNSYRCSVAVFLKDKRISKVSFIGDISGLNLEG